MVNRMVAFTIETLLNFIFACELIGLCLTKSTTFWILGTCHASFLWLVWKITPIPQVVRENNVITKWKTTSLQLLVHLVMTVWGYQLLQSTPFLTDAQHMFAPGTFNTGILTMYDTQLAFWVYEGVSLSMTHQRERHRDFSVMLGHHVVTIALMMGSAAIQQYHAGSVVLLIHDLTDITVDVMKLLNYAHWSGLSYWFAAEIVFVLNFILWVGFRLMYFPSHVIYHGFLQPAVTTKILSLMLTILYGMHIWWTFLMGRIGARLCMGQSAQSSTSAEYD